MAAVAGAETGGERTAAARRGFLLLLGTGLLWGTIGVGAKLAYAASSFDAVSVTWLRAAVAAAVYLAVGWATLGRGLFRASRGDLGLMTVLGGVMLVYQWCYLAAVDRLGVAAATLVALCVPPVIVALVSTLFLGEAMTPTLGAALAGAMLGVALLVGAPAAAGRPGALLAGVLLALASAAGIAGHMLGSRRLAGRHPPIRALAVSFAAGTVLFAPVALLHGVELRQPPAGWFWVVYLGIVPSVVAYFLFQRGLRDLPATAASVATLVEPLTAAVLAWLLFGERLGPVGLAGGALLLASIVVLSRRPPESTAVAEEATAL